jgi:hypothetical protein
MTAFQCPSWLPLADRRLNAQTREPLCAPILWLVREPTPGAEVDDGEKELRLARLEALAVAVERWLADPRYVTEQMMIKALRELERRL